MSNPIGRGRQLVVVRRPLGRVKAAGHAQGATVNDMLLAAVGGGLHQLLAGRGEPVQGLELRVSVPVGAPWPRRCWPTSLLRVGVPWLRRQGGSRVNLYVTNVPGSGHNRAWKSPVALTTSSTEHPVDDSAGEGLTGAESAPWQAVGPALDFSGGGLPTRKACKSDPGQLADRPDTPANLSAREPARPKLKHQ